MPNTVTLHCKAGNHSWERERKRGRKPENCPEHSPKAESRATMSSDEAAKRRAAGRAKAKAVRDKEGIKRVLEFSAYIARDAELFASFREGNIQRKEYIKRRGPMPPTPTKPDYDAAKAAGVYGGIEEAA